MKSRPPEGETLSEDIGPCCVIMGIYTWKILGGKKIHFSIRTLQGRSRWPLVEPGPYFEKLEKRWAEKSMTLPETLLSIQLEVFSRVASRENLQKLLPTRSHMTRAPAAIGSAKGRRGSVHARLHTSSPPPLYAQFLFNWNLLLPLGEYISHWHFLTHILSLFFFFLCLAVPTWADCFLVFCMQWFQSLDAECWCSGDIRWEIALQYVLADAPGIFFRSSLSLFASWLVIKRPPFACFLAFSPGSWLVLVILAFSGLAVFLRWGRLYVSEGAKITLLIFTFVDFALLIGEKFNFAGVCFVIFFQTFPP